MGRATFAASPGAFGVFAARASVVLCAERKQAASVARPDVVLVAVVFCEHLPLAVGVEVFHVLAEQAYGGERRVVAARHWASVDADVWCDGVAGRACCAAGSVIGVGARVQVEAGMG